jgi:hypothetical protein
MTETVDPNLYSPQYDMEEQLQPELFSDRSPLRLLLLHSKLYPPVIQHDCLQEKVARPPQHKELAHLPQESPRSSGLHLADCECKTLPTHVRERLPEYPTTCILTLNSCDHTCRFCLRKDSATPRQRGRQEHIVSATWHAISTAATLPQVKSLDVRWRCLTWF